MVTRFQGVNIAVKDLDASVKRYKEAFGLEPKMMGSDMFAFPGLKGATFMLRDVSINLIASEEPNTSIAKFVETRGEGVFLLSLEVDDIEKDVETMKKAGMAFVSEKMMTNKPQTIWVNFGVPKSMSGVQWEIIQLQPGHTWKDVWG